MVFLLLISAFLWVSVISGWFWGDMTLGDMMFWLGAASVTTIITFMGIAVDEIKKGKE